MRRASRALASVVIVVALMPAFAPASANAVSHAEPDIAPRLSRPYGRSYGEWAARWWQWALETPVSAAGSHPVLDAGAVDCGVGQEGEVWFLAGGFLQSEVTRTCQVEPGKALFFPLINSGYFAFLSDPPQERTAAFCRSQIPGVKDIPSFTISATIDGRPVRAPARFFARSPIFEVHLPPPDPQNGEQNVFSFLGFSEEQIPEWTLKPSCDAGFYLFLNPLPPGTHTLAWTASDPTGTNTQDVTYTLTVPPADAQINEKP